MGWMAGYLDVPRGERCRMRARWSHLESGRGGRLRLALSGWGVLGLLAAVMCALAA